MTSHIQFNFLTQSVSAYDAYLMIQDSVRQRREYQLAKAGGADPNHEVQFHIGEWETDLAPVHGDPVSPVIVSANLVVSGFYVEIYFKDSPMYLTIPSTSTITLGWLERQTNGDA